MRTLVLMGGSQARFRILRLLAVSCLPHILRTEAHFIPHQAVAGYDALVEWTLAYIVAGDEAATPRRKCRWTAPHAKPSLVWGMSPYGRSTCLSEKAFYGLPAAMRSKAKPTLVASVPGRVAIASSRGHLPRLFEPLPERPMALAFLHDAKNMASEREKPAGGYGVRFADSPGSGRGPLTERDRDPTGRSRGGKRREAEGRQGGGYV